MNSLIALLVLAVSSHALDCSLYDFSRSKVACALACPSGTVQIANYCLSGSQYLSNSQVFACGGPVSADRRVCCRRGQYVEGSSCLECEGQVYSSGMACCPGDHYLDYSQGAPSCVRLQSGNCPSIAFSAPFKICCPAQQLYNVATAACAPSFSLNCDSSLLACCPTGQMLEHSEQGFICTGSCSWKSSSGLLCQEKYCNTQLASIASGPNQFPSEMLSLSGKCCYGLDSSNCVTDLSKCLTSFANRGWSICCGNGQFYTVSTGVCTEDCEIGYVLLGFFCVAQGKALDLRGMLGQPTEMVATADCNGGVMPPQFPFCCPAGFYVKDNTGCTLCNGNIFLNIDTQVCCPSGHFFNASSGECTFCGGTMDAAMQMCCEVGTYVHYDQAGKTQCVASCSTDNLYMASSCCDSLTAGCSNTYSATTCSPAYFVPNSCRGCPAFCSANAQTCTASFSPTSCSMPCRASEVAVAGVGCLNCDPSCAGCTAPMSSGSCTACAEGYTMLQRTCQACAIGCRTCALATDFCTSCFREANQTLVGGKCYGRCSNGGYFLDPVSLTCQKCSSACAECASSAASCTMCPQSSFLSGTTCLPCSSSCSGCFSSSTACITCSSNHYMTPAGTCVMQCMNVMYSALPSSAWCLPCHPDCDGCTAHPQNCISCALNTTYLDDSLGINICTACRSPCATCLSATECSSCGDGFYLAGWVCAKCDASCLTCNGPSNSNCLSCFGTSNLTPGGFCSGCSSTCAQCSGALCTGCVAGYFIFNGNCLTGCPRGTYQKASACAGCDASCAACNVTACLSCNSGFLYILGSKCYSICPPGYVASSGYCMQITANNNTNSNNNSNNSNNNNYNNNSSNNSSNGSNGSNGSNQTTLTQVGSIVDQTVLVQGRTAYINLYFNSSDILSNSISVNLVNKNNGEVIALIPSAKDVSNNRISFSVALPSGSDLSQYSLIQTSSTSPNGTTSTLVSSQYSNQLLLKDLQSNAFGNMKVLSYIFSSVVLLFALLSKTKGHFTAEEANNIILHALNFAQVCYLFKFATTITDGYIFLNGFGIANLTFFPNFFTPPDYYVEIPVEKSLVPDGNLFRNAGCSLSYQLVVIGALLVAVATSFGVQKARGLNEPPQIRKIMRLGALLFGIGFMNELFFSFVQLIQPVAVAADYASFHNSSMGLSIALLVLIPAVMAGTVFHFYRTYNSDVLEHYYTLREASHFLLAYAQALVMALGVGKPLVGLFLIPLEAVWFSFNFMLYRYGSGTRLSGYKKYWGISGAVSLGYLFLALEWGVGWVAMVVVVSLAMVVLLVYCTYQIVGIYYYNIFPKGKDSHDN